MVARLRGLAVSRSRPPRNRVTAQPRNPEIHMLLHDESPAAVEARERSCILGTYNRTPFHPRAGKGAQLFDAEGRAYWDLFSGITFNVLGHKHTKLVKTMLEKADAVLHVSNLFYHPAQGILVERLVPESG